MGSLRLVAIVLLLGSPAFAQSAPWRGAHSDHRRNPRLRYLDRSYGRGTSSGRGTAKQGEERFEEKGCVGCHGEAGIGGLAPALKSKKGQNVPVWERERILPLRSPFATTVWDFIHRGMPLGNEGTLTADEVYALTAYLLFLNQVIREDEVLDNHRFLPNAAATVAVTGSARAKSPHPLKDGPDPDPSGGDDRIDGGQAVE